MKKNIKEKNQKTTKKSGISLIVLVITIIVIIILAGAVILNLTANNPIDSAKVAKVSQERESLESALMLYTTKQIANTMGEYSSDEIVKGTVSGMTPLVDTATLLTIDSKDLYVALATPVTDELGIPLPTTNGTWYIEPATGKVYIVYETASVYETWMGTYDPTTKVLDNATLNSFIISKDISI